MTDPIADMLTRIRNAQRSRKRSVEIPASKLKQKLADILVAEGYVDQVELKDGMPKMLLVTLKYVDNKPRITDIKRESTPGHRAYRKSNELPKILNGYGVAIISTSRGLMTNKQAKKEGIGGEVLCSIY